MARRVRLESMRGTGMAEQDVVGGGRAKGGGEGDSGMDITESGCAGEKPCDWTLERTIQTEKVCELPPRTQQLMHFSTGFRLAL